MNKKKIFAVLSLTLTCVLSSTAILAKKSAVVLKNPVPGVLCDQYACANAKEGISRPLTEKYLGKVQANKLFSQGEFDKTSFTFANGVYCDVKKQLCYVDRYSNSSVEPKATRQLFGK